MTNFMFTVNSNSGGALIGPAIQIAIFLTAIQLLTNPERSKLPVLNSSVRYSGKVFGLLCFIFEFTEIPLAIHEYKCTADR